MNTDTRHGDHDHHDHGHGHDHHDHGLGGHHHGSGKVLILSVVFALTLAFVETIGGWWADSLALLSDAGHMFTDSSALAIGALAAWMAQRPASRAHSFGLQRAEVLGALFNTVLMIVVVIAIAVSAFQRLTSGDDTVAGLPVLLIGAFGLAMNGGIAAILMRGEQTMNVRSALLHVVGDMLGSVAAFVAGLVIILTGWYPIDPLLSILVSVLITISAVRLLREVVRVLMEGVPKGVDVDQVSQALAGVDGVQSVHDLHIWSLSSSQRALAAHIEIARLTDWDAILPRLQRVLTEQFSISHTTLQPEDRQTARDCEIDIDCGLAS